MPARRCSCASRSTLSPIWWGWGSAAANSWCAEGLPPALEGWNVQRTRPDLGGRHPTLSRHCKERKTLWSVLRKKNIEVLCVVVTRGIRCICRWHRRYPWPPMRSTSCSWTWRPRTWSHQISKETYKKWKVKMHLVKAFLRCTENVISYSDFSLLDQNAKKKVKKKGPIKIAHKTKKSIFTFFFFFKSSRFPFETWEWLTSGNTWILASS